MEKEKKRKGKLNFLCFPFQNEIPDLFILTDIYIWKKGEVDYFVLSHLNYYGKYNRV